MPKLLLVSGPQGPIPPTPPASGPTLGAHLVVSQANDGSGTNPMNSASFTSQSSTSIFVFRMGVALDDSAPTDNYGNTYTKVGTSTPYAGQTEYQMSLYLCQHASGGSGHIIHFAKPNDPTSESAALIVEVVGLNSYEEAANYPSSSPGTSSSVTTTGPCLVLAFWAGDGDQVNTTMTCTAGSPFSVLNTQLVIPTAGAIQCASAATGNNQSAGGYSCTWTWSPTQGAGCYIVGCQ
jgi:hypothetical protein